MTTFVPGICCAHVWITIGLSQQRCEKCLALCTRNETGKIVDYDNGRLIAKHR
jgi:hypothetical protein